MLSKVSWVCPQQLQSHSEVGKINLSRRVYCSPTSGRKYGQSQQSDFCDLAEVGLRKCDARANGTGPLSSSLIGSSCDSLGSLHKGLRSLLQVNFLSNDDQRSVYQCLKIWIELFQSYGFLFECHSTPVLVSAFKSCLDCIRFWYSQGLTWMDYFKYKNAAFFSSQTNQEIPPCKGIDKQPGVLLGGVFYQYLRILKRKGDMTSFALSILMSKKAMPRPTDAMVLASVNQNILTMTSEKDQGDYVFRLDTSYGDQFNDPTFYYHILDTKDFFRDDTFHFKRKHLERAIKRSTREIYSSCILDKSIFEKPFFPSLSACVQSSCMSYGALGYLDEHFRPPIPDLDIKPKLVRAYGYQSPGFGAVDEINEEVRWDDTGLVTGFELDYDPYLEKYKTWYWDLFKKACWEEEPRVKVVGLKEALKIRNISKGPALGYFVMKPLQNFMWRRLQNYWNFELTGQPITERLFNERFGRVSNGARYHSGDYRDATNELHSWCSEAAINELVQLFREQGNDKDFLLELRIILGKTMTNHVYDLKQFEAALTATGTNLVSEWRGDENNQKRGQLMGSIMSFVILCLINISLMRESYEYSHNLVGRCKLGLKPSFAGSYQWFQPLPVWVNGDDCLTAYTSSSFPSLWEGLGDIVGLSKSVGKTYDSPNMASINSRFFQLEESGRWYMIPFVNGGLLHNVKRSVADGQDSAHNPMEMGSKYRDMMECVQHNSELQESLRVRYLYINRKTLSQYKGPWHLPIHFGGLDIPLREPTYFDRQCCSALRRQYKNGALVPRRQNDAEFIMHKKIRSILDAHSPESGWLRCFELEWNDWKTYEGVADYGQLYTSLCYRLWSLRGVKGLHLLPGGKSKFHSVLKYMERLSLKARSYVAEHPNVEPIPVDHLVYRVKESFCPLVMATTELQT